MDRLQNKPTIFLAINSNVMCEHVVSEGVCERYGMPRIYGMVLVRQGRNKPYIHMLSNRKLRDILN
jgi:hypothetical protein